jgi:hypothetical protein
MTGSSADSNSIAAEVDQMEAEYGKNFKVLMSNDQIKGM